MNQSPIKEGDTVITTEKVAGDVPKGIYGEVLFRYTSRDLFEVRFSLPGKRPQVITVTSKQIAL